MAHFEPVGLLGPVLSLLVKLGSQVIVKRSKMSEKVASNKVALVGDAGDEEKAPDVIVPPLPPVAYSALFTGVEATDICLL